jgi:hypothetical protein
MTNETVSTAEFETEKDAGSGDAGLVRLWLSAIDLASREEESWRKEAETTVKTFRNGDSRHNGAIEREQEFNILYSNIETLAPAIYNSTPIPDVRTRYDKNDPVAKEAGDFIERCLSYDLDVDEFDPNMESAVQDSELVGRGVTRVRYVPYISGDNETGERLAWEEVPSEHVPWANFRRGPARCWYDVPWIAFELFLTRDQLLKLSPQLGGKVNLDYSSTEDAEKQSQDSPPPEIFKRARVWEIWDKEKREVIFIATGYKEAPLMVEKDPLGLTQFFPIPRPLMSIQTSDTLVPIPPYRMYKAQAEELSSITVRINALIKMLKVRGVRDAQITEFDAVADSEDGDLVPMEDATALYAQAGGLEKAIWLMPIDMVQATLQGLYVQREQVKQVIYEITGISDILRGASDPNETLGAQNIKAQFGSQRIQRKQKEAARYARDLLRIKAELIANKFQPQTLLMMTGIKLPSAQEKQMVQQRIQQEQLKAQQTGQPPQIPEEAQEILNKPTFEEVMQLLRSDVQRQYRIDVESDSTIRADLARSQENMSMFLQGTAQYIQATAPAVQANIISKKAAVVIYSSFARNYKLGKSAEDALATLEEEAAKAEGQPDPAQQAAEQAQQAEQQKMQFEMQKMEQQAALDRQSKEMDMQMKREEHELQMQKMQADIAFREQELEFKERELQMKERSSLLDASIHQRTAEINAQATEHKARLGMETVEHKARMARQPQREDA